MDQDQSYEEFDILDVNLEGQEWVVALEFDQELRWARKPGLQPRKGNTMRIYTTEEGTIRGAYLGDRKVFYFTPEEFVDELGRREEAAAESYEDVRDDVEGMISTGDARLEAWFLGQAEGKSRGWYAKHATFNAYLVVEASKLLNLIPDAPSLETFATLPSLSKMIEVTQIMTEERAAKDMDLRIDLPENVEAITARAREYDLTLDRGNTRESILMALELAYAVYAENLDGIKLVEG